MTPERQRAYWRSNVRYIVALLAVWLVLSFGAGILLADRLDAIRAFGFPLGFWFATQGSIAGFVLLIFVYVALMNRLDRRHGVYEE
jgi:putative solute:sodium symporter small subunit